MSVTAGNYKSASWQLQMSGRLSNNTVNGTMSMTINQVINKVIALDSLMIPKKKIIGATHCTCICENKILAASDYYFTQPIKVS